MRGKPLCPPPSCSSSRITPAGAGKTVPCCRCSDSSQDHPRRCGENFICFRGFQNASGSPPQVRGKPKPSVVGGLLRRITPAGAGKTHEAYSCDIQEPDHPRRCGENSQVLIYPSSVLGSPPQVRGKHGDSAMMFHGKRITPAGAGKTFCGVATFVVFRDHPRRCGENNTPPQCPRWERGSPPQVRGKPVARDMAVMRLGITPAGAGKTGRRSVGKDMPRDHPRRCGENQYLLGKKTSQQGSPPQVRGKLSRAATLGGKRRITPAGAGKTLKRSFRNQPFCS